MGSVVRGLITLFVLFVALAIGYQIGITQNVAAQLPAGAAPVGYWYGPAGLIHGVVSLFIGLLFFFLLFGVAGAAFWGARGRHGYGWGHAERRARFEALHRELHGEKPASGGTSGSAT